MWASAVKSVAPIGKNPPINELLVKMMLHPRFWVGVLFYLLGTAVYFLLLSKVKFFSVQITMTGLAIVLSVVISHVFFKESISLINLFGVALVLLGTFFVMHH